MNDRFVQRMQDTKVAHDTRVVADFIRIYCDAKHVGEVRRPIGTDAEQLGVYGRRVPVLCADCEAHLAYAEKRRAYCAHDPKPFCAHCETQCYRPEELAWQAQMMRFSGPRSWYQGHMIDGIRHAMEGRRFKKEMARRAEAAAGTTREEAS